MKTGIVPRPSDVSLELIAVSGGVEIRVICQRVIDRFRMPDE